ncbi:MAG: UDP-N-acetylmuramoyl-L-alanine--D-glutamate ligase [Chitinophagales bacterium]
MKDKLIILGAGESGVGAALLGKQQGFDVFLSDSGAISEKYKTELKTAGLEFEEGRHSLGIIKSADLIVKSPGIPDTAECLTGAKQKDISIISEIEFASRFTSAKLIAITGSNGKTTCSSLTYDIFKRAGLNVSLAGNIGQSFARQVTEQDTEHYILELSSFQLDGIVDFHPYISVILNITPDHLDRYDYQMKNYAQSKFSITKNQTEQDYFIYCNEDPVTLEYLEKTEIKAQKLHFGLKKQPGASAWIEQDQLIIHHKNQFNMLISDLSLKGNHNAYNSMASGILARTIDIKKEVIRESLSDFKGIPHRLETVAKVGGVAYINDSKATNVNSTWYALECAEGPVVWIAGGIDKGNDYSVLIPLVRKKVKAIVCLGKNNLGIHNAFSRYVDMIVNTESAVEAVRMAQHLAEKNDTVLLSPACASFDLFKNYEDRGNQFKSAVREL